MLLVKTKIGPSKITGMGIFADEEIPIGTPIWKFEEAYDLKISKDKFETLSPQGKAQILNYAYFDEKVGMYILCGDDARFFNHSDNPNVDSEELGGIDRANRDIKKGEELTQNYFQFDGDGVRKLESVTA